MKYYSKYNQLHCTWHLAALSLNLFSLLECSICSNACDQNVGLKYRVKAFAQQ